MNRPDTKYHHGQEVIVFTHKGEMQGRGRVVGINICNPTHYDVMPTGQQSLRHAMLAIPESQVAAMTAPYLAYERRECEPKHVLDEA